MASAIIPDGEKIEFWDVLPVLAATNINVGDLLFWDTTSNSVKPANAFTWLTDAPTTRKRFKRFFVGVAAEPHFASTAFVLASPNFLIKVIQFGKFTATQASAALANVGNLIGPDSAASLLTNQQVIRVQDPTEAIGEYARYYGSSVAGAPVLANATTVEVYIRGNFECVFSRPETCKKGTKEFEIATTAASGTTFALAVAADLFFGGGVEILKLTWIEQVAITTNPLIIRITKNSAGTPVVFATDFNVPVAGAAIGRVFTQDYTAEAGRFFDSSDTIDLKTQATAPAAGQGQLTFTYRPLN